MRIPFGKTSLLLVAFTACALAQDKDNPEVVTDAKETAVPTTPPPPAQAPRDPVDAVTSKSDTSAALDYLYNRKPEEGSAGEKAAIAGERAEGKAVAEDAVGIPREEDPELRARFDRYLSSKEVSQEVLDAYFAQMAQISELLRDGDVFEAWKQLYNLADYGVIDAGISRELANRIESIWTAGKATAGLDRRNEQLRQDVSKANRNADMISEDVLQRQLEYQRKLNAVGGRTRQSQQNQQNQQNGGNIPPVQNPANAAPGAPTPPSIEGLEGRLQMTAEYLRSLELNARIKLNQLKQEKMFEQAKSDFAEFISTLYKTGRLNHVVLAADFYRKVFQEGDYPPDMTRQVSASLETNRDVKNSVDVFRYKLDRGQLAGATDSLRQAFMINEMNIAVLGLERTLKEKAADFVQKLDQMRNLIEARDFGTLETLLQEIKASASDFDTTKPTAIVNAVKLESKMRLGKAKLAAQQGNLQLAMDEFQAAAKAWPGNPDLEDKAVTFFDTQDVKSQTTVEFDRLVEEQNYRAIFDKQLAFAPAIAGDPKREEALKKALEAIKEAEVASEKASVMMMNGDSFGAWEAIELASENLPDDRKLNKLRADLSSRSSEFVSAVNKARDAEARDEIGFSLTWYVNAQRQYPASRIANEGITRLTGKLLQTDM